MKWIKRIPFVLVGLLLAGCATSTVTWQSEGQPKYTLTGKPAEEMGAVLARNALDKQGRQNELQKYNAWLYLGLVIFLVAGLAFWGYTRSRYGWVIPAAAIGGIGFITFWSAYGQ